MSRRLLTSTLVAALLCAAFVWGNALADSGESGKTAVVSDVGSRLLAMERAGRGEQAEAVAALRSTIQAGALPLLRQAINQMVQEDEDVSLPAAAVLALVSHIPKEEFAALLRSTQFSKRTYGRIRSGQHEQEERARPRPSDIDLRAALSDIGPALAAQLAIPPESLAQCEAEFASYYHDELQPRLQGERRGVAAEDVVAANLDMDDELEMGVAAAWPKTFFFHGLRFIAVLDKDPCDVWSTRLFTRLPSGGIIDDRWVMDLDGNGTLEFVISWVLIGKGPTYEFMVVSRHNETWSVHQLSSAYPVTVVQDREGEDPVALISWRPADAPWTYAEASSGDLVRWTPSGFVPEGRIISPRQE
jgi:hypothetical protein